MSKAEFILKRRTPGNGTRWSAWETLWKTSTIELVDASIGDVLPARDPTHQYAVFHQGKIIRWWEGEKDILDRSRAAPPPNPILADDVPDYLRFVFLNPATGRIAAECVARDEDTALRMLGNDVLGWDIEKLEMQERGPADGPNHWVGIWPESKP